ncbi:MAG: DUF2148 domain-containing protein [Syntrophorhabdales bacterium]
MVVRQASRKARLKPRGGSLRRLSWRSASFGKLAAEMGIDNRIMYTVGAAAKALRLLDSDIIIGIPLSATGKNPFFDRP